jgi:hypothetical protein
VTGDRSVFFRLILLVAVMQMMYSPALVAAVQVSNLPAGVLSVEVDGHPVDSQTSPTTNSSTPEISGRVDEAIQALDLEVVDGESIRFTATVGGSGRFRAVPPQELVDGTYSLFANDALIGTFTIAEGSPGPRSPGALLDIARAVPYPADAADTLPGLAFVDGRFVNLSEEAARTAARNPGGPSARELERQLAMAGWLQRYENRLAVPSDADPTTFDLQITSFVVEYASGADARAAFDSLGSSNASDFPTIGDESQLVLLSGTTTDTGTSYQAARLAFRVGPLLVVIVVADLLNQPPDLALLESIGTLVAERGRLVADRQPIPLGSMALRLDLEGADSDLSPQALYAIRAGLMTPVFGETDDAQTDRAVMLAGTTDAFTFSASGSFFRSESRGTAPPADIDASPTTGSDSTASSTPLASPPKTIVYETSLFAFPTESDAEVWLANQQNAPATESTDTTIIEAVSDVSAIGDATSVYAVTSVHDGGTALSGYRLLARSGAIVSIMEIQSAPAVSLGDAISLMEEQLDCIAAQGCAGSASLPSSILGDWERPSD